MILHFAVTGILAQLAINTDSSSASYKGISGFITVLPMALLTLYPLIMGVILSISLLRDALVRLKFFHFIR